MRQRQFLVLLGALLTCAALLVLAARPAGAHGALIAAVPEAGATLTAAPEQIRLTFNEPLGPGSTFFMFDGSFQTLPGVRPAISATDPTVMWAAPPPLSVGRYTVQWTAVGTDGHPAEGSYSFTIREGGVALRSVLALAALAVLVATGLFWQRERQRA